MKDIKFKHLTLEEFKQKACHGKRKYINHHEAIKSFQISKEQWNIKKKNPLNSNLLVCLYQCPFCYSYHIGHESRIIEHLSDITSTSLFDFIKWKFKERFGK